MKIAVVHDWLVTYAGAEKVLEQIVNVFHDSDLFTITNHLDNQIDLQVNKIKTSYIQKFPFSKKYYRQFLPFMPHAISRFDLSQYDLILSSSHAVAKGVKTRKNQLHISYIHTPIRYAWDLRDQYLNEAAFFGLKRKMANILLDRIKTWDYKNSQRVDYFIANSKYIQDRVKNNYNRESHVIYPPVDVERFTIKKEKENFFFTASRFVPYKKINLIVEAFSYMPEKKLIIIGHGPDFEKLYNIAGPNIKLLGYQSKKVLVEHMQRAKAFVFAAEEDFGILPVEAQACGTPVIAFGKGGALETVVEGKTGLFFNEQSPESLMDAVHRFEDESNSFNPVAIRKNAEKFSVDCFKTEFKSYVNKKILEFYT